MQKLSKETKPLLYPYEVLRARFDIRDFFLKIIVKHSNATEISVQIESSTQTLILQVGDNGQGFDVSEIENSSATNVGLGLRNIKNRTQMIGGEFSIKSERSKGTLVRVSLPQQTTLASS